MNELRLDGCRPTPLASYLKALGVLRLVAEQADPQARGFWRGERFHLKTRLDRAGLHRFFLEDYAPTPIIAPWNGRAGFLEGESGAGDEGDESERDAEIEEQFSNRKGAKLRRDYEQTSTPRFQRLHRAVQAFASLPILAELDRSRARRKTLEKQFPKSRRTPEIRAEIANLSKIEKAAKEGFVSALRDHVDDEQYVWLDVCIRLAESRENSPLLIGGGADGSRDYGMAFGLALQNIFSFEDGKAREGERGSWISASLFGDAVPLDDRDSFGHFQPGQAGYNATNGYELDKEKSPLNPWDVVLALEGAVLWSGGVTRRLESVADTSAASFPFCVETSRSGAGQLSSEDQNRAPGEVWCPLWSRPTGLSELRGLFREGRLTIGKRTARNGLDAALAVAGLGRSRGIAGFVRVGLYQSDAKMPHTATPLRRHVAGSAPDAALLGAELADHRWMASLRRHARTKEAPAALRHGIKTLEDALFGLAALPGEGGSARADAARELLIAFGRLGRIVATRPKLRESLLPPPVLSARWAEAADDGSAEFRVAAALAGLRAKLAGDGENATEPPTETEPQNRPRYGLYMRQHLAPLDPDRRRYAYPAWNTDSGAALAVWGPGSLIDNLCAVAQRRLLEMRRARLPDKPFSASLASRNGAAIPVAVDHDTIATFLDASEGSDARVADLIAGLVWVEPAPPRDKPRDASLPFTYAALKPLFATGAALDRIRPELPELPIPPALPALLMSGQIDEALRVGQERARASGLPTPFLQRRHPDAPRRPPDIRSGRRLLAALIIPALDEVLGSCLDQAYPSDEETEHAA